MSWLTLLLDDAPAAAFDAARDAALAGASSAAERAAVETEAAVAQRLRTQLLDHRRRLAELAALNDIGVRLTALRDLDPLLQEVVNQARRLLDVDVAYLALREPDDSLTILVTDGSLGPHLRGVRLSPHSGLAGRVVDSGEPVSSSDYLADPDITHSQEADRIAGVEGLRTITGVPLRRHGEVIGVLMTAQREVHPPTPNDLSLLMSLASLAAVAIENARLFTQHTEAVQDLAAANDELRRAAESVSRATTLHEQLMEAALRGGGVVQVIASLSEVVDADVLLSDPDDRIVVSARAGQVVEATSALLAADGQRPSEVFAQRVGERLVVDGNVATAPVTAVDTYFGAVQVHAAAPLDEVTLRLVERSAITIALLESAERAIAAAQQRTVDDLLEHLLTRPVLDDDASARQARSFGVDLSTPHLLLVVEPEPDQGAAADDALTRMVRTSGGLVGHLSGHVVAVVDAATDISVIAPDGRCPFGTIGVAGPVAGASALATAYKEARDCLTTLLALDRPHSVAGAADLGPFRLLLSTSGRADAVRYVRSSLGVLLDYDERRGSDLVATAGTYLALGQRHAETARALNVHPNTLYQRLRRIDSILGAGWCHESRALDIQLALRLHGLLGQPA